MDYWLDALNMNLKPSFGAIFPGRTNQIRSWKAAYTMPEV